MQNDMESLVSSIKQLNALLVVTVPDCLLYSSWQRGGQTWDAETAGAFLGQLVHSTQQGGQATDGWTTGLATITLESDRGLIILRQVKDPFTVAYVFEQGTAIGWARLQVQRTLGSVEGSLDSVSAPAPAPAPKPIVAAPPPMPAAAPAPVAPAPPAPAPAAPAPRPAPAPAPKPAVAPAPRPAAPAPKPTPVTAPAPRPVAPAPKPTPAPAAAKPPEPKPAGGGDQDPTPKGTRLLKYLDTHAPDTHAALLRVSLQTGLPLTLLRMPDSLSDDEFAQVEESVRRILGVDQLNF